MKQKAKKIFDKIIRYIKGHKRLTVCVGVSAVMFGIILMLNFLSQYVADDWCYFFIYDHAGNPTPDTKRVKTIFDVIVSMKNHWKIWNGRVVAHGLLQLALSTSRPGFSKVIFNIINALIYTSLGWLIYLHAMYGKKTHSVTLLTGIYVLMWLFLPQFGLSVLWASGAANYLWCAVLILAFLLPYRMYAANQSAVKDSIKNAVLMGIFGLFAGCTNENTGGGVLLTSILFIIFYRIKGQKVPKWSWIGALTSVGGMLVLLTSPGNYRVSSKADLAELLKRFADVFDKTRELTYVLIIILAVLAVITAADRTRATKNGRNFLVPIIYLISAAAMMCVLTFSAMRPERAWFTAIVFIIIAVGWFWTEISFKNISPIMVRAAKWLATGVALVVFIVSFNNALGDLRSTYAQVKEGIDIVDEAVRTGEKNVTIPIPVPSDSKYDPYNGAGYIKESANDWTNLWMAEYYGLDGISGKTVNKD